MRFYRAYLVYRAAQGLEGGHKVFHNIGASIIANTILGAPYYNCRIMGPKTLFEVLRPLYYNLKQKSTTTWGSCDNQGTLV